MKKVFSLIWKITSAVGCLFFLFCSAVFMPSLGSVMFILCTALLFPMDKWQNILKEKLCLTMVLKILVVVFLFFDGVFLSSDGDASFYLFLGILNLPLLGIVVWCLLKRDGIKEQREVFLSQNPAERLEVKDKEVKSHRQKMKNKREQAEEERANREAIRAARIKEQRAAYQAQLKQKRERAEAEETRRNAERERKRAELESIRKPAKEFGRVAFLSVAGFLVLFILIIAIPTPADWEAESSVEDPSAETETAVDSGKIIEQADETHAVESEPVVEEVPGYLPFLDEFTKYGYTEEQIEEMRTILVNVGVTELVDLEIGEVSYGMQVVKGLAYKDEKFAGLKDVDLRFNIENGVIYYVNLYDSGEDYLDGTDDGSAELYYDTAGGYLKRVDWEERVIVEFSSEEVAELLNKDPLEVGATESNPIVITADELAKDIKRDFESAKEEYSNKWVKITGKITGTSDAGNMYGYYLYGKKGESGLRIICWCDDGPYSGSVTGDTQTFLGYLRQISVDGTNEIGDCERIVE